jgi:hypothetical protein
MKSPELQNLDSPPMSDLSSSDDEAGPEGGVAMDLEDVVTTDGSNEPVSSPVEGSPDGSPAEGNPAEAAPARVADPAKVVDPEPTKTS